MSIEREIPIPVQAVDAFGVHAVRKFFPNWEHRNDLNEQDFSEIAENSKMIFATDGNVLLPSQYLKAKGSKLIRIKASDAFRIFGLKALAKVSERGVAQLSPGAMERFQKLRESRLGHLRTQEVWF